jgi:dihydrofolate reductase
VIISLLVAMDLRRGIGKGGKVPWHLSADLQLFRRLTLSHHILMGRKTYESIGRALPGRIILVLSRAKDWSAPGVVMFDRLPAAFKYAEEQGEKEIFVIGGGEVFEQTLDIAQRIYLTQVETDANSKVFFPQIDPEEWRTVEVGRHSADNKNEHAFIFFILDRIA